MVLLHLLLLHHLLLLLLLLLLSVVVPGTEVQKSSVIATIEIVSPPKNSPFLKFYTGKKSYCWCSPRIRSPVVVGGARRPRGPVPAVVRVHVVSAAVARRVDVLVGLLVHRVLAGGGEEEKKITFCGKIQKAVKEQFVNRTDQLRSKTFSKILGCSLASGFLACAAIKKWCGKCASVSKQFSLLTCCLLFCCCCCCCCCGGCGGGLMVRLPPLFNTWGERTFELIMGREFFWGSFFWGKRLSFAKIFVDCVEIFPLCPGKRSEWVCRHFLGHKKKRGNRTLHPSDNLCSFSLLFVCIYVGTAGLPPPKLRKSV